METIVSIGNQGFDKIREAGSFYIDKTYFIKEWWESRDVITLITRPRRFGKTLNMNMLYCFFQTNMPIEVICLRICLYGKKKNTEKYREHILPYF